MFGNAQGVPHWWRRRHVVYRPGPDSLGDQEHDISHAELGISVDRFYSPGCALTKCQYRRTEFDATVPSTHVRRLSQQDT